MKIKKRYLKSFYNNMLQVITTFTMVFAFSIDFISNKESFILFSILMLVSFTNIMILSKYSKDFK